MKFEHHLVVKKLVLAMAERVFVTGKEAKEAWSYVRTTVAIVAVVVRSTININSTIIL